MDTILIVLISIIIILIILAVKKWNPKEIIDTFSNQSINNNINKEKNNEETNKEINEEINKKTNTDKEIDKKIDKEIEEEKKNEMTDIEGGFCYNPEMRDTDLTNNLDDSLVRQMSQVENAGDFQKLVSQMKKKYDKKLESTIQLLNDNQEQIGSSLQNLERNFDQYGLQLLSKQYYDTIYNYGDFETVKPFIQPYQNQQKEEKPKQITAPLLNVQNQISNSITNDIQPEQDNTINSNN